MMRHPLDGITVVALEQAVAAPFATRQLADLGARVIKIERPGQGDFARGHDRTVHGQSSYGRDIKSPDDRVVLDALIERADVFTGQDRKPIRTSSTVCARHARGSVFEHVDQYYGLMQLRYNFRIEPVSTGNEQARARACTWH
jgi:hypothetical protein